MRAPSRAALRVGRLLGRRGAFLLAMGLSWVCYGYAILTTPIPAAQHMGLSVLMSVAPLSVWGWAWLASGVVGAFFSLVRKVGADQIGFTALVIPAVTWSVGYLIDWALVGGYDRGWVVASTYAGIAASIVIASGWPEVRKTRDGDDV